MRDCLSPTGLTQVQPRVCLSITRVQFSTPLVCGRGRTLYWGLDTSCFLAHLVTYLDSNEWVKKTSLMQMLPYGALNGLMSMDMTLIIYSILQSHQSSTQLNTCGRFWSDALDSALHPPPIKALKEGIFWQNGVDAFSRVYRLGESVRNSSEAVLPAWGGTTTSRTLFVCL